MSNPKTIFCDIDGTIFNYPLNNIAKQPIDKPVVLPGVAAVFAEWDTLGYKIILTTGRRESTRKQTEKQLADCGIFYDQLIMGLGGGQRVLINDKADDKAYPQAVAINVIRNKGL